MTLLDTISARALAARKARDPSAGVLVTLLGEIANREKTLSPPRPLTDEEVVAVVRKFLKSVQDSLQALEAPGRAAAAEKARPALEIERVTLEALLPQQLDAAQIEAVIAPLVRQGFVLGAVMAEMKRRHAGCYDGRLASEIARRLLAESAAG